MSTPSLGRLERVELREAWTSESSHFTPWLAQEENLRLLGEAIGIELELESQEKEVGPFRADILCRDTATDNWVLIENQLERTDHTHLGQLLTYAAGLNAVTIVWIAKRFTDEHRAALDWLNERTDISINLFGLEVELWRIGNSPIAPKFNIISQPNDWSRTVQRAAAGTNDMRPIKQLQLRYWTAFKEHMESVSSVVRCTKPGAQHWMNHPIGRSGVHLGSVVSSWSSETNRKGGEIRVELYLDGPRAKLELAALERCRGELEGTLGFPLTFHDREGNVQARIYTRKDADYQDEALWPEQFAWLRDRLERMYKVFKPVMLDLKTALVEGGDEGE